MAETHKMLSQDKLDALIKATQTEFAMTNVYTRSAAMETIGNVLVALGYDKVWVDIDVSKRAHDLYEESEGENE